MLSERDKLSQALTGFPEAGRRRLIDIVAPTRFAARFSAGALEQLSQATDLDRDGVMRALLPLAAAYARAPISGFAVGAAALGASGTLHLGANLEFAGTSLWASLHAEQSVIARAWAAGENAITALAVDSAPCGHCRQFMAELGDPTQLSITVRDTTTTLAALLPNAFGPADLGRRGGLLDGPRRALRLVHGSDEPITRAAFAAAELSYAPYAQAEAGVALRLRSGTIVSGRYAESAAHNPSLSPMAMALSQLRLDGGSDEDIVAAVLVAVGSSTIDHAGPARLILGAAAPGVRLALRPAEVATGASDHDIRA